MTSVIIDGHNVNVWYSRCQRHSQLKSLKWLSQEKSNGSWHDEHLLVITTWIKGHHYVWHVLCKFKISDLECEYSELTLQEKPGQNLQILKCNDNNCDTKYHFNADKICSRPASVTRQDMHWSTTYIMTTLERVTIIMLKIIIERGIKR